MRGARADPGDVAAGPLLDRDVREVCQAHEDVGRLDDPAPGMPGALHPDPTAAVPGQDG